jgi:hypothetical protein
MRHCCCLSHCRLDRRCIPLIPLSLIHQCCHSCRSINAVTLVGPLLLTRPSKPFAKPRTSRCCLSLGRHPSQDCVGPLVIDYVLPQHQGCCHRKSGRLVCTVHSRVSDHWQGHCEALPCHHLHNEAPRAGPCVPSQQDHPCHAWHRQACHA